jgi:SEC-C motif
MSIQPPVLDPAQLKRIEAVHRGFVYQHLYAVGCLLLAARAGASAVVVEADEDIEIAFPDRHLYAQVKTRSQPLTEGDIEGAIERFAKLRQEHADGRRPGTAAFAVVANVPTGPKLTERLKSADWPVDTTLHWPGSETADEALPAARRDVPDVFAACAALASTLPFGSLVPETLVWKLAGVVMAAASGTPPRTDHAFESKDLPALFEQLAIQLQDFPAPPPRYRSQAAEPELASDARIRAITGFSGAGKTMWVAQAAQHSSAALAYFDVGDTPGPAIAIPLARELAGRFFGRSGGALGQILLPGATGAEMLRAIGLRLRAEKVDATIVIDNAHRIPAENLRAVVQQIPQAHFILLAQPGATVQELEATLTLTSESLHGWATDTIAAEVADHGCRADYAACERLRNLTAGLPLYVQNAMQLTAAQYGGDVARFCDELEARTHDAATAQETILARVFDGLASPSRDAVAILGLADIPLERAEAETLLEHAIGLDARAFARVVRELRPVGVIELFGGDRLKIHDAMRVLGRAHLDGLCLAVQRAAQSALKKVLLASILRQKDLAKLSLYLRILADLGDLKMLVEFATDELFHEMGLIEQISGMLEAAASDATSPEQRFAALDGLAFGDFKRGDIPKVTERLAAMERLIADHDLDDEHRLTLAMKSMNIAARLGDVERVFAELEKVSVLVPNKPGHLRIFRYNTAHALYDLGRYDACSEITESLIAEYYEVLGIESDDVMMKNPDKIWPLLKKGVDHRDDLKHLADCLDLHAHAVNRMERAAPLARIHAMKFYSMANALDSYVRVGQDLVDELVGRHDYIGARDVFERNLLPTVIERKMVSRIVPARSQYAVVLAYCGDHDAAAAEIAKLEPYEAGLDPEARIELGRQRRLIERLRRVAPPPQWEFPAPSRKIGRNERCYCGSGKKFKHCHGNRS